MQRGRVETAMLGVGGSFVVTAALWASIFGLH
jgi:hypothetical protein